MILLNIYRNLRWRFFTAFVKLRSGAKLGDRVRINHYCKFTSKTVVGSNSHFNGMRISGNGNVTIGDNCHSGIDIRIITSNHNYKEGRAIPYDDTWIDKDVVIEDNVWIGERVIILGGVHIGEGSIIQAGSVVVFDIPPLAIVGGHPAKPFSYRNSKHYYELKKAGKVF